MSMQIIEVMRGVKQAVDATVNPGDDVLILGSTDRNPIVYEALSAACSAMGCEVILALISPRSRFQAEEPPNAITKAMSGADVVFQCLSTSLAVTKACDIASKAGARQVSFFLPKGQEISFFKSFEEIDLEEARRYTLSGHQLILDAMKSGREVHLTSNLGTDLKFLLFKDIDEFYSHWGISVGPHRQPIDTFTAWPPACIHPFVEEGSAEGIFVADASVDAVGPLSENMRLYFEQGQLTKIEGGAEAKQLESLLAGSDKNARIFCMFGIGSNPFIQETEFVGTHRRKAGYIIINWGRNKITSITLPSGKKIEGQTESNFHGGAATRKATCVIGGMEIIKNGVPRWK